MCLPKLVANKSEVSSVYANGSTAVYKKKIQTREVKNYQKNCEDEAMYEAQILKTQASPKKKVN